MECLIKEYGKKRVDLMKVNRVKNIEQALDAWKEYSINPYFFVNKDFRHEFDDYEDLVKNLNNYFNDQCN